ncbi:MAG: hypothetical protein IJ324_00910 [Lachnospiraceae bacterium]|nr:hypothetical protein [Lachnospiraceae bacterium]
MANVDMEFDEKTMIREQERLEKEKKRKKHKKIRRIIFLVVLLVICVVIGFLLWRSKTAGQEEATVEVVTQAGQEIVIAKISQINGNEITYVVGEESQQNPGRSGERPERGEAPEGGEMPDMGSVPEGMEMPDMGSMPEGMEMPDMGSIPEGMEMPDMGSMPEGMEMPDMGSMPEEMEMPDMSDMSQGRGQGRGQGGEQSRTGTQGQNRGEGQGGRGENMAAVAAEDGITYDGVLYKMGEESFTTYIPVGTVVTTKLGTETTFSRLAAGDYVALVVDGQGDEQVIMAVYIIG